MNTKRGMVLNEVIFSFSSPYRDKILVENVSPVARQSPVKDVICGKICRLFQRISLNLRVYCWFSYENGKQIWW